MQARMRIRWRDQVSYQDLGGAGVSICTPPGGQHSYRLFVTPSAECAIINGHGCPPATRRSAGLPQILRPNIPRTAGEVELTLE